MQVHNEHKVEDLIGEEVTGVAFIYSDMAFYFGHKGLNLLVLPVLIEADSKRVEPGTLGYRDNLCMLIGDRVKSIEIAPHSGAVLQFNSGKSIRVDAQFVDQPEFLQYCPGQGLPIQVW